ncbi:MAG: hypothetical protein MZV64_30500 [Ignavibacteriales bacterium]|nr:hypothetical protein [Ignavibacteriales bacterium]
MSIKPMTLYEALVMFILLFGGFGLIFPVIPGEAPQEIKARPTRRSCEISKSFFALQRQSFWGFYSASLRTLKCSPFLPHPIPTN